MKIDEIGQNIKRYRKDKNMTQKEMASKLFMEVRNYAKIERGEKKTLCISTLIRIAEVFGVSIQALISSEEEVERLNEQKEEESMIRKSLFSKINKLQKELAAIKTSQHSLKDKLEKIGPG